MGSKKITMNNSKVKKNKTQGPFGLSLF